MTARQADDAYFDTVIQNDKAEVLRGNSSVKGSSVLLGVAIGLVVAGLAVAAVASNSRGGRS